MSATTPNPRTPCGARQRGTAALVVTLMLLFAMALLVAFTNRNLVLEQRASANQYRSTQAFEAAEAGIDWALAQLGTNRRIGADCETSVDPSMPSFRGHALTIDRQSGAITPSGLEAACVRGPSGWQCTCPASGAPVLTKPAGTAPAPAFRVRFMPSPEAGSVRIVANGCTSLAGACLAGATDRADASAKVEVVARLVAGLRTPPAATLTARGHVDAGLAAIGLHNTDAATGIAVDAGGAVDATHARLTPPAGGSTSGLLVADDTALAALDADRFFAAHFGLDKATWQGQPAVIRIACTTDCAAVLGAALDAAPDAALIHVDGDLALAGPLTLGSTQRPVVVVVSGAARLTGGVALTGVLHAASIEWSQPATGGFVHGALLVDTTYRGDGAPDLAYDPAVLEALTHTAGSFARVAGSWRDF